MLDVCVLCLYVCGGGGVCVVVVVMVVGCIMLDARVRVMVVVWWCAILDVFVCGGVVVVVK